MRRLWCLSDAADHTAHGKTDMLQRPVRQKVQRKEFIRIKIISMGDGGVGKSCLIKRYCEEKFVSKYITTIGVDFGVKPVIIDGREVKVNFWDLAGHPEFHDIRNEFYKDAQGAVLVYDVSSRKSFEGLEGWLKEASKYGAKDTTIFVAANKVDKEKRQVSEKEGRQWAAAHNFDFFETSAKDGDNVQLLFSTLFSRVNANFKAQGALARGR